MCRSSEVERRVVQWGSRVDLSLGWVSGKSQEQSMSGWETLAGKIVYDLSKELGFFKKWKL